MQPLLKLTNIKRSYGAIQALRGADFEIMPGEVIGLVGGKTALGSQRWLRSSAVLTVGLPVSIF